MSNLPLQLILCLLVLITRIEGQKCRLVMPSHTQRDTASTSSSTATPSTTAAFGYGIQPVRGVNLYVQPSPVNCVFLMLHQRGGWFVLEPWITPSIFQNTNNNDIIDEYTFGQMQDYNTALGVLTNHWQTWITEQDFIAIHNAGLSHVRYVNVYIYTPGLYIVFIPSFAQYTNRVLEYTTH